MKEERAVNGCVPLTFAESDLMTDVVRSILSLSDNSGRPRHISATISPRSSLFPPPLHTTLQTTFGFILSPHVFILAAPFSEHSFDLVLRLRCITPITGRVTPRRLYYSPSGFHRLSPSRRRPRP